jgi:TM2 domain-containing membrane protein YozV
VEEPLAELACYLDEFGPVETVADIPATSAADGLLCAVDDAELGDFLDELIAGSVVSDASPEVGTLLMASQSTARTHRVIVAPPRGGASQSIARTHSVVVAAPRGSASHVVSRTLQQPSAAGKAKASAPVSSAGASTESSGEPSEQSQTASNTPPPRAPCSFCGGGMVGNGRGYCAVAECRERSTLVVVHARRQSGGGKAARVAALDAHDSDDATELAPVAASDKPAVGAADGAGSAQAAQAAQAEPPPAYSRACTTASAALARSAAAAAAAERSLLTEAYVLALPLGFAGAHWFYLGRPRWGVLYLCAFGLLGVGWLADLLRMRALVRRSRRGFARDGCAELLSDVRVLWLSPLGIVGGLHHWALGRARWARLHCLTLGVFGVGWLTDGCRLASLVAECLEQADAAAAASASGAPAVAAAQAACCGLELLLRPSGGGERGGGCAAPGASADSADEQQP